MPETSEHPEPEAPRRRGRQQLRGALDFIANQPGLSVTIGYALTSLLGMMFTWALFNEFGIPYFQFAEITDFLLAVVREPVTFLLVLGAVPVAALLYRGSLYTQRFYARRRHKSFVYRSLHGLDRGLGATPAGFLFVLLSYTFLFVVLYANWKADRLMAGDRSRVSVQLTQEAGPVFGGRSHAELTLLGTTARFVFLFESTQRTTFIVPTENIAAIRFPEPAGSRDGAPSAPPSKAGAPEPEPPVQPDGNDGSHPPAVENRADGNVTTAPGEASGTAST